MKINNKFIIHLFVIISFLLFPVDCFSANVNSEITRDTGNYIAHLKSLSLEALGDIEVTSVSKKTQRIQDTAAAVYVITNEDIRRSGITILPEVMRLAPGVQVARISSNLWAITIRGFNNRFANKLLVLIDGRSVYSQFFSGLFWHTKDVMLDDVDRIEVIRGPGAALWGANAVNGVINIITKKAADTQGGLVTLGAGNELNSFGGIRYGGKISDTTFYRTYVKFSNHDDSPLFPESAHIKNDDNWDSLQGGFRLDSEVSEQSSFTLQGDIYDGDSGDLANNLGFPGNNVEPNRRFAGGNILGRWNHSYSETSEMILQAYYDRTDEQFDFLGTDSLRLAVNTFDIDFQHRFKLSENQDFIWGLGFRYSVDNVSNADNLIITPSSRDTQLYSAFFHDEITLVQDKLNFILGGKYEHNDFTGSEFQPNVRLVWTPNEQHSLWASASRAVRSPNRVDHDMNFRFLSPPPVLVDLYGDKRVDSEVLNAYEMGYRIKPNERLRLEISSFYNEYEKFMDFRIDSFVFPVLTQTNDNLYDMESFGAELNTDWQMLSWWSLGASYSYINFILEFPFSAERTPEYQYNLKSSMNLPFNLEFDLHLRFVDRVDRRPTFLIDSYAALDGRLAWKVSDNLELSVAAQNLFDKRHSEFADEIFIRNLNPKGGFLPFEIERSVYAKIAYRF